MVAGWRPGTESDADGAFPTPTITHEQGWWLATFADEETRDAVLAMREEVARLREALVTERARAIARDWHGFKTNAEFDQMAHKELQLEGLLP